MEEKRRCEGQFSVRSLKLCEFAVEVEDGYALQEGYEDVSEVPSTLSTLYVRTMA